MDNWLNFCFNPSSTEVDLCLKETRDKKSKYNIQNVICDEDKKWFADMMSNKVPVPTTCVKKLHILIGHQLSAKGYLTEKFGLLDNNTISCNFDQILIIEQVDRKKN